MHIVRNIFTHTTCVILLVAALAGCTSKDAVDPPPEAVEVLYNRAYDRFLDGAMKDAVQGFEEVERQHPYSEWAVRAQIMGAYASYRSGQYDDAILTLERFLKLHPGHRDAAYAYYLIAISYYDQITDVARDQKITEQAMSALKEVISRYPDTEYARDANLKLDLTVDHLAGKEMKIGRYYQDRKEYIAAINRFRTVVERYQTTGHTPEALHRLVECYLMIGVNEEAKKYAAVLGHNFPGSDWYRYSYNLMQGSDLPEPENAKSGVSRFIPKLF